MDVRTLTLARLQKKLFQRKLANKAGISCSNSLTKTGDSIKDISARIKKEGNSSWKDWLFNFVDSFKRTPSKKFVEEPPLPGTSPKIHALMASTVEYLCSSKRIPAPVWCARVPPLPDPWFVAEAESLKASALAESPAQFRKRNIFVLGNFLKRA